MRPSRVFAASVALTLTCLPAAAQRGQQQEDRPPRPERAAAQRLSAERTEAAWHWQAKGVAHDLKLTDEQAGQLVEAYVASRKSLEKAREEARDQGRDRARDQGRDRARDQGDFRRGGRRGAMGEQAQAARDTLAGAIKGFLAPEQTKPALAALGTFNPGWDRMVDTIVGFELEPAKTHAALTPIKVYVVKTAAMRRDGDWQSMREDMRDARDGLEGALGMLLSTEQMSDFRKATSRMGGQRGGRGFSADRLLEFDENGDGMIQASELPDRMQRLMDRLDENGDGVIDADELKAMEGGRGGRREFPGI